MTTHYRMHCFADPAAPLGAGRPLAGRNAAEAIFEAGALWNDGPYAWALGYRVVDSDDGAVLWQRQRERRPDARLQPAHGR